MGTLKLHAVTVCQLIDDGLINPNDLRAWNDRKGMKSKGCFLLEEDTEAVAPGFVDIQEPFTIQSGKKCFIIGSFPQSLHPLVSLFSSG